MRKYSAISRLLLFVAGSILLYACATQGAGIGQLHRWWAGLGPVLPHESFPADCSLCHVGDKWNTMREDFRFDHERKTGVKLEGAHTRAMCLRCHNDRGPVATFKAQGCTGCHEDVHVGKLGGKCDSCHQEESWKAKGMRAKHMSTRFPLTGAHAAVSCHRCHPGSWVGNFTPADPDCVTCHAGKVIDTRNPPHIPLGWTKDCQRCHMPTRWTQATRR